MKLAENEGQRTKIAINVGILLLAIYSLSQRQVFVEQTSFFDRWIIDTLAPFQKTIYLLQKEMGGYVDHYVLNLNASKENGNLRKQIAELESKIFSFEESIKESERIKELISYGETVERKKIIARVVSWDSSNDFKVIRINKGLKAGVKLQSAVATDEGLVGYVYRLTDHFADVVTVLDPNNRIDGTVERIRSHGILEGYKSGHCIMKYVNRTEPIVLNDLVITSGLGNVYPPGLKIGYISRIERESYGITQHIEVSPIVNFSKLEEVLVLVSSQEESKQLEWKALDEHQNNADEGR